MKPLKALSRSETNQRYLAGYLPDYKQTGWKLEPNGKHIRFTDGCGIGRLRLVGNPKQQIAAFPEQQIKRVRIVHRADGYYVQFAVQASRLIVHQPSGHQVGIDLGLLSFLTDSEGHTVENPRHLRKAEKRLKRLHRRLSRKQKKSQNRKKARKQLASPNPSVMSPGVSFWPGSSIMEGCTGLKFSRWNRPGLPNSVAPVGVWSRRHSP